jgi:hypothetical protein
MQPCNFTIFTFRTSIALAASIPLASSSFIVSHAENVRNHLEFISPLLQTSSSHSARLTLLKDVKVHHFVLDCGNGRFCCDFLIGEPEVLIILID